MNRVVEFERMAAGHWRGTEEEWLGKWLLRAAGGFTGRANSALPLGDPGMPLDRAVAAVADWYRARGLPPMIVVPMPLDADGPGEGAADGAGAGLDGYLAARNWSTRPGPAFVMVTELPLAAGARPLPPGAEFLVDAEPDVDWLARYHYRGQGGRPRAMVEVLTSASEQAFASLRRGAEVLAIARLSIAAGWAGITAVEVHQDWRRAGLGTLITAAACAEAEARGARRAFLQVEVGNAAARALYERCGFRYSHRYHYRVAPAA